MSNNIPFHSRLMVVFFIVVCGVLPVSCRHDATDNGLPRQEISAPLPASPDQLEMTAERRAELRSLLDVFYTKNPVRWQQARTQILAMQDVGIEALCIFMLKFFAAGRSNDMVEAIDDPSEYWQPAQKELVAIGDKAVPYVLIQMAQPRLGTTGRMLCSMTLAQIGQPAVPMLIDNLSKGSSVFRRIVLETLGAIGDERAAPAIAEMYSLLPKPQSRDEDAPDPSSDLRQYAVKALGKIKSVEGLSTLAEALSDPSPYVREKAVEAVAEFRSREALPALEKALSVAQGENLAKVRRAIRRIQSR